MENETAVRQFLARVPEPSILKQLDAFHDSQFTKAIRDSNEYLYTAWLAYENMCKHKSLENCRDILPNAIMFQCTKDSRAGTNLAIDKEFVDEFLELEKVYLLTHQCNKAEQKFNRLILSCGSVQNEAITWAQPNQNDLDHFVKHHHVPFYACSSKKNVNA